MAMYNNFYGFSEEPFNLNPDPRFLYLALSHMEALSSMMQGIKERENTIVVTGEVGVGKTILIYALLKDLGEKIRTAFVFQTRLDFKNLLKNILRDLEVPLNGNEASIQSLVAGFRNYLNERYTQDETVAIIIDEAQSLDAEVLEGLLRLSTMGSPAAKVLQIVLVGHPELEMKLNSGSLRQFKEKIGLRCRIKPLTRNEGRGYLKHRLNLVGRNISDFFTPEAADRIWEFAGGIPRIMNLLCAQTFVIGERKSSQKIDSKIVSEGIKDLGHLRPSKSRILPRERSNGRPHYPVVRILFLLFSVSLFLLSIGKILSLLFLK